MRSVNQILGVGFDAWFSFLKPLPAAATLAVVAAATAVMILLVMRTVSDQRALVAVKRQMHADLFEIRLFNDDLAAMFRATRGFLWHNGTYLRLTFIASLWTVIPIVIAMPHLNAYFAHHGPGIGRPILLTAQLAPHVDPEATLDLPPGVRAETPPVWFPGLRQMVWRLTADASGDYRLSLRVGGESFEKTLHVSDRLARRSPVRPRAGLPDEWFHPSESPLAASALLEFIGVGYPDRVFEILGWRASWLVLYVGEVFLFAVLLRRPLRVAL